MIQSPCREYDFVTQSQKFTCGKPEELLNFRVRQLYVYIYQLQSGTIVDLCEREDKREDEHKNSGYLLPWHVSVIGHVQCQRGPVDPWTRGPVDPWTRGPVDPWTRGPVDPWTRGPVDPWTRGPVDPWTRGPVDPWTRTPW